MADLRIATRGSRLAMTQARYVADRLGDAHPGLEVEIVEIATSGDVDRTTPVTALTEMGAFVRAVQVAVLDGRADLAVHSAKDLPTTGPEGLCPVYPGRERPWDVLCGATPETLPAGATVGTGSPRRAAQLRLLRPDLSIVGIRGNVETRLDKVGEAVDAVVLAEAGLHRLGLDDRIDHRFGLDEMVPAPAQAALCVEVVGHAVDLVMAIDDAAIRRLVEAERRLLAETGAGCRSALGALAREDGSSIRLTAFVEDDAGPRRIAVTAPDGPSAVSAVRQGLGV
ncbi:MAG: hydroxymethylbilane synthase [Acidimicrobiia bacterium]